MSIIGIINNIRNNFFCNKEQKFFIRHNERVWKKSSPSDRGIVLLEYTNLQPYLLIWSYFANIFSYKYRYSMCTYSEYPRICNRALSKIFSSFGATTHIIEKLNSKQISEKNEILCKLWNEIKTKNDIFKISVRNIEIGVDIYSTYIRTYNEPTVKLFSDKLKKIINKAVTKVIFWDDFIQVNNVKCILPTHDCYLFNIIICVGRKYGIPAYISTFTGIYKCIENDSSGSNFKKYRKIFSKLPDEEKSAGKRWAKRQLKERFSGKIDLGISYEKKSAFSKIDKNNRILKQSEKTKVLICSHCFFDDPFVYGWHLFPDFYEWLLHLGELSEQTCYDWYLKMHPDYMYWPGTEETIKKILSKYSQIKLIDASISHKQLAAEGLDVALTVYGTVGCEYPLLGVNVINAGNNPHIAYNFNYNPKTIEEYDKIILNLDKLPKINVENVREDIYEFFYTHFQYDPIYRIKFLLGKNIFFNDLAILNKKLGVERIDGTNICCDSIYKYFLDEWDEELHHCIINYYMKVVKP
ncbi:hypothetical protein [Pectinatus frisingensis]|uniref:hypothetical protein n=1 Tax=Pectinatus frisingensis TaxID=865 RepID=UPI0015F3A057|nr:hypothetical protein [Pectinatus frisingensis]